MVRTLEHTSAAALAIEQGRPSGQHGSVPTAGAERLAGRRVAAEHEAACFRWGISSPDQSRNHHVKGLIHKMGQNMGLNLSGL
jgi:hypothetical protein